MGRKMPEIFKRLCGSGKPQSAGSAPQSAKSFKTHTQSDAGVFHLLTLDGQAPNQDRLVAAGSIVQTRSSTRNGTLHHFGRVPRAEWGKHVSTSAAAAASSVAPGRFPVTKEVIVHPPGHQIPQGVVVQHNDHELGQPIFVAYEDGSTLDFQSHRKQLRELHQQGKFPHKP